MQTTLITQKLVSCWYRCRVNKRINLPADEGNTVGEWAIWCTLVMQTGEVARQVRHPTPEQCFLQCLFFHLPIFQYTAQYRVRHHEQYSSRTGQSVILTQNKDGRTVPDIIIHVINSSNVTVASNKPLVILGHWLQCWESLSCFGKFCVTVFIWKFVFSSHKTWQTPDWVSQGFWGLRGSRWILQMGHFTKICCSCANWTQKSWWRSDMGSQHRTFPNLIK